MTTPAESKLAPGNGDVTDKKVTQSKPFMTEKELAARQDRAVKTLRNQRVRGDGVPFVKLGRTVRYRLTDVIAWEDAHLRRSTSDVGGGQ